MTHISAPSGAILTLPAGYALESPADVGISAAAVQAYGGATMNWAMDGAGVWFLGCCAKKDGGPLLFTIFALHNGALANVPISGAGTGRGWLDVASDGWMYWSSWEGSSIQPAGPPGRVPEAQRVSAPSGGGGGGGYAIAPNGSIRAFMDVDGFTGQQLVNLAALNIPVCQALNVRLALNAAIGVKLRCGPPVADPAMQAAAMLTVSGVGAQSRVYESGVISTTPSRTLLVAAEGGALAQGFVDITGWWM